MRFHHNAPDFAGAIATAEKMMVHSSEEIHTERWQGMDISKRPDARMRELAFYSFSANMTTESLTDYREEIGPSLPWADMHFEQERVSGEPINPGETWKRWPYGHSAAGHLEDGQQFNHSYAERYWPKFAGMTEGGLLTAEQRDGIYQGHRGIRHPYGDLMGVVRHLVKEPLTRQAFLPIWFPEDTGDAHSGRKPCTLGYHFMMRKGKLHVVYYIRSCDLVRHFRDDIYLTIRLVLWVLEKARELDRLWLRVTPGEFYMVISSLHCFVNDWQRLCVLDMGKE